MSVEAVSQYRPRTGKLEGAMGPCTRYCDRVRSFTMSTIYATRDTKHTVQHTTHANTTVSDGFGRARGGVSVYLNGAVEGAEGEQGVAALGKGRDGDCAHWVGQVMGLPAHIDATAGPRGAASLDEVPPPPVPNVSKQQQQPQRWAEVYRLLSLMRPMSWCG